jgi:hypothetical protein
MTRLLPALLLLGAISFGPAANAQEAHPAPMADEELARERAGFVTAGGLQIGFGASVRTYVDGQLALETRLTWTQQGAVTERIGDLAAVTAAGLPQGWGVIPGLTGGETRLLHDLQNGRIASVVLNTASERSIRQDTNITLTIPQLAELQAQLSAERIASTIQGAVGQALVDRIGR